MFVPRHSESTRRIPSVVALALLVGPLLMTSAAALHAAQQPADAPDAVPVVLVTRPAPGAGRSVELPGSFEPYEQALLYARVTGYAASVDVDIGDRVERGAILVRLDLPEMKPELRHAEADATAAKAELRKARAEADLARITHDRLSLLQSREPMAVTDQDVDIAAAEREVAAARVETAAAEVEVAKARIAELQAMMSYALIRAPFDGVVARRFFDAGALVVSGADGGEPVLELVREDRLRLVLAIPESIVSQVRNGTETEITVDAVPGQMFRAAVSRCAGPLMQDTRSMRAEIDMDDHDGTLRPGMYATVRLLLATSADSVTVPASLIHHESGNAFVWTIRDGVAEKTPVQIERDDGDRAVIEAGLEPESVIVLAAPRDLREGQTVRARFKEEGTSR